MGERAEPRDQPGAALRDGYDESLPLVYGYFVTRVGSRAVAEDLTSTTYLAAVDSVLKGGVADPSIAWLLGIARHKLVDHWRREEREQRRLHAVADLRDDAEDPWAAHLDAAHAHHVMGLLGAHHRAALALRYIDGLPVAEVAQLLGRSLHATEALLVRARVAFRAAYEGALDA